MSEQPRDWDRELAAIDKVVDQQGGGPPGPGGRVAPAGSAPAPAPTGAPVRRRSVALTWFWVLLALAMAAALPLWPYQQDCGLQLAFFLGAVALTMVVGVLGAASSWANRRGFAHVLSLLVVAWAGVMAAGAILPRTGYARESKTWTCPAAPEPAPGPAQPAPGAQPPAP